jgi:hypothetical protein
MEYWWNYTDKAKPKYSEENLKWCNFVHEEAHMVWSGNQASAVEKKVKVKVSRNRPSWPKGFRVG